MLWPTKQHLCYGHLSNNKHQRGSSVRGTQLCATLLPPAPTTSSLAGGTCTDQDCTIPGRPGCRMDPDDEGF